MFNRGQVLKNDVDFDNAMLFAAPIEVWQHGYMISHLEIIRSHNEAAVYVEDGGYYLKRVCEFRTK